MILIEAQVKRLNGDKPALISKEFINVDHIVRVQSSSLTSDGNSICINDDSETILEMTGHREPIRIKESIESFVSRVAVMGRVGYLHPKTWQE